MVNTSYDLAGRPSSVSNGTGTTYATTISYASHGVIQQMNLGSLVEQTCFNNRLQPTAIRLGFSASTNCSSVGTDRLDLTYSYGTTSNNGNLLSQIISRPVFGFTATQNYTALNPYDGVNRLQSVQETGPGTGWSEQYDYDAFGNRWLTSPTPPTAETPFGPNWFINNNSTTNRVTGCGFSSQSITRSPLKPITHSPARSISVLL